MPTMKKKKNKRDKAFVWGVATLMAMVLVLGAFSIINALIKVDGTRHRNQIQTVRLMKPPPPPKMKEKPPEPEIQKKEEIIEQQSEEPKPEPTKDQANDEPPPGDDLGLDAEGSGGSDGFGLRSKKGGHSLIGGIASEASLLRRYAWYTRIVQEELRKKLNKLMDNQGGIPEGDLRAWIEIELDDSGFIKRFNIYRKSGVPQMDKALKKILTMANISEPPPKNMPRRLKLKIAAKG
jgi:periplasmic protein TonB